MNKIKSISRYVAAVTDPLEEVEQWALKSYREFDIEGRDLIDAHYSPNGKLESKSVQKFNDKGQLIEQITYFSEDEIAEHFQFFYHENGKIEKQTIHYADGSISVKIFSRSGNKLSIEVRDDEGDSEGKEERIFDENGNLLEEEIWDEDGIIVSKTIIEYDEEGNQRVKTEYGEEEEFISKTYYKFDENGNQIELVSLTENNELKSRRISHFNESKQLVEEEVDGYKIKYEYDPTGMRIRDEITDPHNNIESFTEYTYGENQQIEKSISCEKGNLAYNADATNKGGKLAAFLVSQYKYEYF